MDREITAMAIKLYSGPLSLFSRKIEIALREKDLAFERVMVPFTQAAGYHPKHPDVLAANPKAQVPVLIDGPLTLFDSTVIFEYLEDAYPRPALYPEGPRHRARCRLAELTADEILLPTVARLMYRTEPPDPDPERQRNREQDGTRAESERRDVILGGPGRDILSGGPAEDWILGGPENDVLSGGLDKQASDLLFGGPGNDDEQQD